METETFLLLAVRLNYLDDNRASHALDLINQIGRMLTVLRAKVSKSTSWPTSTHLIPRAQGLRPRA